MSVPDVSIGLDLEPYFPGDSEMAARMRAFDWSKSDLGPPQDWPHNLRFAVSVCLTSGFPILLSWGPELTVLYNDAYIPFLGETKHPRSLALPARQVWPEIWDTIGPMLRSVCTTGRAIGSGDFPFFFARKLPLEEVYVRFTYAPILRADGRTVEGIFTPCTETTDQVIGARRLETLRKLGVAAPKARTVAAACREATEVLSEGPRDVPFAAIYVMDEDGTRATLVASTGLPPGAIEAGLLPSSVSPMSDESSPWPLASLLRDPRPAEVDLSVLDLRLPGGPWPDQARTALLLPITGAHSNLAGLVVVGVSSRQPLNDAYRTFFDLVAGQIAAGIANGQAHEEAQRRMERVENEYERMAALVNAADISLAFVDTEGYFRLVNDTWLWRGGRDRERVVGHRVEEFAGGELASEFQATVERVLATGEPSVARDYFLRTDANPESYYVDRFIQPIRDSSGVITGILTIGIDVTEKVHARQQAEAQRAVLQTIFDTTPVGIALYDRDMRLIDFNNEYESMIDPSVSISRGQVLYDMYPATLERKPVYDRVFAGESVEQKSVPYQYSGEEVRYRDARYRPVRDSSGEVVGLLSTVVDVTGEVLASQQVESQRALLRTILESAPVGIAFYDREMRIIDFNGEYKGMTDEYSGVLGNDGTFTRGQILYELYPTALPRKPMHDRVLAGESVEDRNYRFDYPNGEARYLEVRYRPVWDGKGEVTGMVTTMVDVTERKRAEEALRESEARFRTVADLVPDLLWSRDSQGALEWYNQRWTEYTGQSSEDAARLGWLDVIHQDDREQSLQRLENALSSGQPLYHERRLRGTDGSYRWFLVRMEPMHDEDGRILHWFATATDIHEQRMARDELEERVGQRTAALIQANEQLQVQVAARETVEEELHITNDRLRSLSGRLLEVQEEERHTVARELHDEIGQQLTALRFTLEGLGQDPAGRRTHHLGGALSVVDSLTTQVRELSLNLRPPMLDDEGLGPGLLWQAERYTAQTGIEVKLAHRGLEERLPPPVETAVYRIVQEALTNVARHAGVRQVTVQVLSDGNVTALIEDVGRGFDVGEALARHTSTGLSGMRERVELLGGQLMIESSPGSGTRIMADIPFDALRRLKKQK